MFDHLIIGGDAALGQRIVQRLQVSGSSVCRTSRRAAEADDRVFLDLQDTRDLGHLPAAKHVILVAAETRFQVCAEERDASRVINVKAPVEIARHMMTQHGSDVFFLSSAAVHSGTVPFALEAEVPTPVTEYGRQKLEAEHQLRELSNANGRNLTILRPSKVVPTDFPLFSDWLNKLQRGNVITPFTSLITSMITADLLLDVTEALLRQKADDVFQLSASDQTSYAVLAHHMAQQIGADADLVQPVSGRETLNAQNGWFPEHVAMNMRNTQSATGIALPRSIDALDAFIEANVPTVGVR